LSKGIKPITDAIFILLSGRFTTKNQQRLTCVLGLLSLLNLISLELAVARVPYRASPAFVVEEISASKNPIKRRKNKNVGCNN
jgi:hypothetical protein